ncbi:PH, RCC1 and FYVE domains-containing protein 1-like isoform X2 [Magnolia sinica]|uniref:PH, RCC1 and FYVE domains-containing protein 1-like isoform X2 n=1 Tax=Magnolia sinica TaxID=86752 RepID=UPI002657C6A8|nr:PH, RCC1 and FYVE domains-containing protein 1-like isoform X2 [Magnolia sinica]XP_058083883.1 PH, RCC1 and FYVE domains-containing protein 1-like isoform X2 [Magnolia sinica]
MRSNSNLAVYQELFLDNVHGALRYTMHKARSTDIEPWLEDIKKDRVEVLDIRAIFRRYPRPEKEYQSFSLIYNDRSLDLISKDKDEAEVWFVALKALISHGNYRKWRSESRSDRASSDANSPKTLTGRISPWTSQYDITDILQKDPGDAQQIQVPFENPPNNDLTKAVSDELLNTAAAKGSNQSDSVTNSRNSLSSGGGDNLNGRSSTADDLNGRSSTADDLNGRSSTADNLNGRSSTADNLNGRSSTADNRVSLSSAVSSSSQGSCHEDFDAIGDVFIWGEGLGGGVLGGGMHRVGSLSAAKMDTLLPKALESVVVLDVQNIACGSKHAVLVTKQGEVFSWGEESGGRLGHGVEADVTHPKLVNALSGMNVELVACGEYHTCAVTLSGDLYTWGDGTLDSGILGHGNEASHWIPKRVSGQMEGIHVLSVACGPRHTAVVTSAGQLFTFGEGTFGALGHGDRKSVSMPREVESLTGLRTVRAACGVWHTAAVVEFLDESSGTGMPSGKLFTWGDGDKGRLGHGDNEPRLVPACVAALVEPSFSQVACGNEITVALSTSGRVYAMGSTVNGQLGNPEADGKAPSCIEGKICQSIVEEIACGSYHVAVLTSKTEVYTWGKGANGRLGHGDNDDRNTPTLIEALKNKQVKSVVCGSNFTAAICLHKWVSSADHSICSGCHNQFGFRRKRHNCYNCGLVFCKACSRRKSTKASLAPNMNKPYRVCDDCYTKLKKLIEVRLISRPAKNSSGSTTQSSNEVGEKESPDPKSLRQLCRLLSLGSFKHTDMQNSKSNRKAESRISRFSPSLGGSAQWGNLYASRSSNKIFSSSVPSSRMVSRATSPVLMRPSPSRSTTLPPTPTGLTSAEVAVNDSEQTNDKFSDEVVKLRVQVEDLTRKSQLLEVELERTLKQLNKATLTSREETAKCKAAKDVIRSLTAQLKDMADRVPEGSHTFNVPSLDSSDNCLSSVKAPHELESNGHPSNPQLCNGTKNLTEEVEWVEQDDPGVYITLSPLPRGGQELRRVRFSRKKFSEKQAEKWWAENKERVYKKYNRTTEKSIGGPVSALDEKDGPAD